MLDIDLGGEDNILAYTGFQIKEPSLLSTVTVVRKLVTGDLKADHPIVPGEMTVIWAHGNPNSTNPNTLQYHGANNRGFQSVNFFVNGTRNFVLN